MSMKDKNVQKEIETLFTRYNDQLKTQKKQVLDELSKWSKDLIRQIEEHTNTQKKALDEQFGKRKSFFDTEQKRITTAIIDHEKKQETQEIERHLTEWRKLILNLPISCAYEKTSIYMRVLLEEETPEKQRQRNEAQKLNENPDTTRNNNHARRRALPDTTPTMENEPSTSIAYDCASSDFNGKETGSMLEKCPICFMIFPKDMNRDDRAIHVNEHYTD